MINQKILDETVKEFWSQEGIVKDIMVNAALSRDCWIFGWNFLVRAICEVYKHKVKLASSSVVERGSVKSEVVRSIRT